MDKRLRCINAPYLQLFHISALQYLLGSRYIILPIFLLFYCIKIMTLSPFFPQMPLNLVYIRNGDATFSFPILSSISLASVEFFRTVYISSSPVALHVGAESRLQPRMTCRKFQISVALLDLP